RVDDPDPDLRVAYQPAAPLTVTGDVWIDAAAYAPGAARRLPPPAPLRSSARLVKELFPSVSLDVGVHARGSGVRVLVPHLPGVAVTFDCRLRGSPRAPTLSGRARGGNLYSGMALFLYDVFAGAHVRRCAAAR